MVDFARLLRDGPPPAPRLPRLILGVAGHRPHKLESRPGAGDGYDRDNPLRVRIRARLREETERLRAEPREPRGRFTALHVDAALQRTEWRLEFWRPASGGAWGSRTSPWSRSRGRSAGGPPSLGRRTPRCSPPRPACSRSRLTALHARNDRLCAVVDELIAVWDGTRGGTASCVRNWWYIGNELRARIDPNREREALEVSDGER